MKSQTLRSKASVWTAVLTVAFVVFQHYQLILIGTYPLTVGLFLGFGLLFATVERLNVPGAIGLAFVLVAPNAVATIFWPDISEPSSKFFSSLLLFVVASLILAQHSVGIRTAAKEGIIRGAYISLGIVVSLSIGQVVLGSRGSTALFNLWGSHQYLYEYNPELQFNPIPRAEAFYLEPSYAAFIIGTLGIILVANRRRPVLAASMTVVGLLAVRSATGLILFGLILLLWVLLSRSFAVPIALVATFLAGSLVWGYLLSRLGSANTNGSSANYRLVAPLQVLGDTLLNTPLGHPFGSIPDVLSGYDLLNGAAVGTSLDNGIYVLVFYYGWIGLIAICLGFGVLIRHVGMAVAQRDAMKAVGPLWIFGSLLFSGGIMLPEFVLSIWMLLATMPTNSKENFSEFRAVNSDGHIPGFRGFISNSPISKGGRLE